MPGWPDRRARASRLASRPALPSPRQPVGGAVSSGQRALLVGVTDFQDPRLKSRGLKGPANDVELLRQVLTRAPLSVPPANIRSSDAAPTRRCGRRMRTSSANSSRLAQVSKNGRSIVILLAGHGSQQPANADPSRRRARRPRRDFSARRYRPWDGKIGRVKNARRRRRDSRVGRTDIRSTRRVRVADLRRLPLGHDDARSSKSSGRSLCRSWSRRGDRRQPPGRPSAARTQSRTSWAFRIRPATWRRFTPRTWPKRRRKSRCRTAESPIHGLFTYTIADILSQSSSALTYRELALRVLERYRSVPRYSPTPLFEGGGLDRRAPRTATWPERPQMLLGDRLASGSWTFAGRKRPWLDGRLDPRGLSPGRHRAQTRESATSRSWASNPRRRRTSRRPTIASLPGAIAPGHRQPRSRALLRVRRLPAESGFHTGSPRCDRTGTRESSASTNGLAGRAEPARADWLPAGQIDGRVVLQSSEQSQANAENQFLIGDLTDPKIAERISSALRRIGRARNLMRLAAASGSGLRLDLRVIRYRERVVVCGTAAVSGAGRRADSRRRVRGISRSQFEAHRPVDVTVLSIDAAFGIQPLYPARDREIDNQLKPGEERVSAVLP